MCSKKIFSYDIQFVSYMRLKRNNEILGETIQNIFLKTGWEINNYFSEN